MTLTTAYIIVAVYHIALIALMILLARHAPRAEHMAKPWIGNFVVGLLGCLFFLAWTIHFLIKDRDPMAVILLILELLPVSIMVMHFTCRMWLTDTCIIQQNFWGRQRKWYYKDIVQIEEEGYEVIFHFRNTRKWLIYGHDPKEDDPMLEAIKERIPEEQLVDELPVPPVRLFENSVRNASGMIVIWVIMEVLSGSMAIFFAVIRAWIGVLFCLPFLAFWVIYHIVAVYTAKRAHVSEKCARVAKFCFKDGFLRP